MSLAKKILTCLIAAAMTLSLASCGEDTSWSAVIDGIEVRTGIFIRYQMEAFENAIAYVPPEGYDEMGGLRADFNFLDMLIEEQTAHDWINDQAVLKMRDFAATELKFSELGLSLSANDNERAIANVNQLWDYDPSLASYGIPGGTLGAMYEGFGISKQSLVDVNLNEVKRLEIFKYYYGADGIEAVSDEEIRQYVLENSAWVKYIEMPLRDGEGNLLKSEGKAERLEMANDYLERAKAGESMDALIEEFNTFYDELVAAFAPPQIDWELVDVEGADGNHWRDPSYDPDNPDAYDEYLAAQEAAGVTGATGEEPQVAAEDDEEREPADYSVIISKTGTTPHQEVIDRVFGGSMSPGDIVLIELDEVYYVVELFDILSREDYIEQVDMSVRHIMKGEDFMAMLASWTEGQSVKLNDAAFKRYSPKVFMDYLA